MARLIAFSLGMFGATAALFASERPWRLAAGSLLWQLFLAALIVYWPAQAIYRVEMKSPLRERTTRREIARAVVGGVVAAAATGLLAWLAGAALALGNLAIESRAWLFATILVDGVIVLIFPGMVWLWFFPTPKETS